MFFYLFVVAFFVLFVVAVIFVMSIHIFVSSLNVSVIKIWYGFAHIFRSYARVATL